ncbi:MAG: hypothetical protein IJX91_04710 [Clostridia bacterium]|nr:hypothetical protein [Clostridia bacterium]
MNPKKTKRFLKRSLSLALATATVFSAASLGACKDDGNDNAVYFDNESDPLVFSSQEVDKVFNPFFSTTAADSNVVGLTQIGMLTNDKDGNPVYGDDEAVVTKDLEIVTKGTEDVDQTTTYYFVLKNDVKFSNGSLLTIKDVLFNLYVYLDPAYTGSSTIYSTDIVGLDEYRTQETNENEQDNFKVQFEVVAESRIDALIDACAEILQDHENEDLSDKFEEYLAEYTEYSDTYANVVKDYEKALELFREELETDYSNSLDSYADTSFTDDEGKVHKNLFTTDVEMFLYNEGYISWNKKDGKLTSSLVNDPAELKTWTKEKAIETILADKIPNSIEEVLMYWNTSVTLNTYLVNEAMENYFSDPSKRKFNSISGIRFANREQPVEVNGVEYGVPVYDEDGVLKSGNEVLSIQINNVDPKAIWNFSFGVAPMYYYSDAEHIEKFDYVSNFGVEYCSQTFMSTVVKDPDKIGVPVGAGPYAASKSSGGIQNIKAGDFYSLGVIYFERNPYFVLGAPKIKKVRYQVVASAQMLNSLYNGEIDFAEPNAKPETISELDGKKSNGIGNKSIQTAGYGYIGINAGKVPDLAVRQAIMHSINTQECVDYYKTTAKAIYRSMSLSSWAYPKGCTPYYPYVGGAIPEDLSVVNPAYAEYVTKLGKKAGEKLTEAEQKNFLVSLVEGAGYTLNGNGVYQKGANVLKYTFTIAGEETDHPAWDAMYHASELLNKVGFQTYVTTDSNALKKLSTGDLTVWAAAWGSTIDPDMYQVYHKESNATSVLNWGYKQILLNVGGKYDTEVALIDSLSDLIDAARRTNDQNRRSYIYSQALDIVMQLAIELPTYQRDDLFAYNTNKIDVSTLTPDSELSSFQGLTTNLWTVSLNQAK